MRRHFWRHVDFSELAELYASRTMRLLAFSMVGVFVAIFLYQMGFSVAFIAFYLFCSFVYRALLMIPFARLVARLGPKHTTLISNLLYVPALVTLATLPLIGLPALVVFALLQGASVSLYQLSYLVNFSSVKHVDHAGKELGYMYILERIATGLSPIIGGFIAFLFGPQATLLAAAVLFFIAATPLFFSPEPVQTHQHVTFKGFNWRRAWRGIMAHGAIGADFAASGQTWALYIAIVVFGVSSNDVYVKVGAVTSITLLVAITSARIYGRLIDRRRGGDLLKFSVVGNMALHIYRIFVTTPTSVVGTNVANEAFTTGQNMPFVRGMFEMSDSLPGYRVVYLAIMQIAYMLGSATFFLALAICAWSLGDVGGIKLSFVLLVPVLILITAHGFKVLRR